MKKFVCLIAALCMILSLSCPVFASEMPPAVQPRLVMRETIGYEADVTDINWEANRVGTVSGNNSASSTPMVISFIYNTSGSKTATVSGSLTGEYKRNLFLADVSATLQFDVGFSRSWTSGTSSGVTASIDPYKCQIISAYIPDVSTSGSMKIKVYNDSTPHQYYYEYEPVSANYLPAKDHIHFVKRDVSPSEFLSYINSPGTFSTY